jgi:hypothetical protein
MTRAEMQKVKIGLADLFKTGTNPIVRKFEPRADDWEDWEAFQGAYEEALHLLRLDVVKTAERDEKKMHGFRKVNPRMQEARREQRGILREARHSKKSGEIQIETGTV